MNPLLLLGDRGLDQLTLVSAVTKERDFFLKEGLKLSRKMKSQPQLEKYMERQAALLSSKLQKGEIDWLEFRAEFVDQIFISAVASFYLGTANQQDLNELFAQAVGNISNHLPEMLKQAKEFYDRESGAKEFAEDDDTFGWLSEDDELNDDPYMAAAVYGGVAAAGKYLQELPASQMSAAQIKQWRDTELAKKLAKKPATPQRIASWAGLLDRMKRYMVTPTYHHWRQGEHRTMIRQGKKYMRRRCLNDRHSCSDCIYYDSLGFQALGDLPLPGEECSCLDRCRCHVEYSVFPENFSPKPF